MNAVNRFRTVRLGAVEDGQYYTGDYVDNNPPGDVGPSTIVLPDPTAQQLQIASTFNPPTAQEYSSGVPYAGTGLTPQGLPPSLGPFSNLLPGPSPRVTYPSSNSSIMLPSLSSLSGLLPIAALGIVAALVLGGGGGRRRRR